MATQPPSARRSRKLRRRFSSSGGGWPTSSPPRSLASAPSPTRNQSSPSTRSAGLHIYQRPHLTDGSDYEEYQPLSLAEHRHRGRSSSPTRRIFAERPPPTAYASLPPTPILPSRPITPPVATDFEPPKARSPSSDVPFSLWDYLREELLATDFDSHQELKWERVSNFLSMPWAMEKVCDSCFISVF